MTLLTSLLHATNFSHPFLRTLIPSVATAFGLQAAVAIPSIALQSERFYDLSGSLTYLTCTALSLYLPALRARALATASGKPLPPLPSILAALRAQPNAGLNWRQVLLSTAVSIWATRLGSFLFSRITAEDGRDSRFDKIRGSPAKFLVAFVAQATWVSLCLMPVLAVNSLPLSAFPVGYGLGLVDAVGLLMYIGGIVFESTADRQKSRWMDEKKAKKHSEEFLTRGLWSKSRHPNYFGEVTLWSGIATTAAGSLASGPGLAGIGLATGLPGIVTALAMAGVSPAFVSFLLFKVSGIPLSEGKYDKRFKDNKDYWKWKRETPMFFPKLW